MFYRIISLILIISSFGISFFPVQPSVLRLLGFLILLLHDGITKREVKIIAIITMILSLYYLNSEINFSFFKYLKNKTLNINVT